MTTDEELAALVLPWAKAEHPDKYQQTLAVAANPKSFRRFLVRLVELRVESDKAWSLQVPLDVLDETRLVLPFLTPSGDRWEVGGAKADPMKITHRFWELALAIRDDNEFQRLQHTKKTLDLFQVPETRS